MLKLGNENLFENSIYSTILGALLSCLWIINYMPN